MLELQGRIDELEAKLKEADLGSDEYLELEKQLESLRAEMRSLGGGTEDLNKDQQVFNETLNELKTRLREVTQEEKLAAETGEEYNAVAERRKALLDAVNELIDHGFTIEGEGVQFLLNNYDQLLQAYEEQEAAERRRAQQQERLQERAKALNEQFQQQLETEQEHADKRLEFWRMQESETDQEIARIRREKEEFIEAGIDRVAAERWAQSEIDKIRQEAHRQEIQRIQQLASQYITTMGDIFSQIFALRQANLNSQLEAVQREHDQELEDLRDKLERGIITEEEYNERKKELEEEQQKEEARIRYRAELAAWRAQLVRAIATGAEAILSGFATQPFIPAGLAAGALASVLTGLQIATIRQQKPEPPSFAEGADFIVPPGYEDDNFPFQAQSGERVQVTPTADVAGGSGKLELELSMPEEFDARVRRGLDQGKVTIKRGHLERRARG
jgi:hypothetical protein